MSEAPPTHGEETLAGLIERVAFHNEDNGFCVLRIKARGHKENVAVVGHATKVAAGEWLTASGQWVNDRVHGQQFKASALQTSQPTTLEGIEKYLASGAISGLGPVYAKKLIKAFGEQVLDIIENHPQRLREVEGIGKVRAGRIEAGWAEQRAVREIMLFLHGHGISTARAARIFRAYGGKAMTVLKQDPYRLARDIRGFGFATADEIAGKLGIEKTAMVRVRAGISHALTEAQSEGHCGLPVAELVPLACRLLDVSEELAEEALALELSGGAVVREEVGETVCIFLTALHRAERDIAARVAALNKGDLPWPQIDTAKALPAIERASGFALADSQRQAIALALSSKLTVITGGPGVGKTTIVNAILRLVKGNDLTIILAAPTGRAAKRMAETTGREARTIHRLLEMDPRSGGFLRNAENPIECDFLVVDETSMVDVTVIRALLCALPDHAAVLFVGDIDQLPSIGPGQVLADLIGSGALGVARLREVYRQAAESRIIANAHAINAGQLPDLGATGPDSDFYFVPADDPQAAVGRIIELVSNRIPQRFGFDAIRDVQVLSPMNRGAVGVLALNLELKEALNPAGGEKLERFGWTYSPGDKVMQTENDYDREIYNGDIGYVRAVIGAGGEAELDVDFDGRSLSFAFNELDSLVPAYAATIHKSQGSEYPAVVMPVVTQHAIMLRRNLIYTGVTRAKQLVVLVGQKKAIAMAVRNQSGRQRWSKLRELLAAAH
ncbi:MAG: ATP-dependent RecD-like DNA helicase [Rhizobiales bacterium]|nr:ATP-dependent RecD-like DNA helicase [Hyphomicrobiales bacterium]